MSGPFSGLKVLELGRFIAVPYCGQLLSDAGAEVVKVEPLEGDNSRKNGQIIPGESRQFLNRNRGKRSIAANLSHPEALACVRDLADRSDIVLANFRPGQAERLGLDYPTLVKRNPRLIYAENTAFGTSGPLAGRPGLDVMMQAYTGLAVPNADRAPAPLENPIIDYAAAMLMTWGVSMALYHRERTGEGQKVDTALLQAALVLQNNHMTHVDAIDEWRKKFVEFRRNSGASGATRADILAKREALNPDAIARTYYGYLPTADGTIAIAAVGKSARAMLQLLGLDDPWIGQPGWEPDDAVEHVRSIYRRAAAVLCTAPTAHWLAEFERVGIPVSDVRFWEELLDDEQAWANGFLVRLEHEVVGGITAVGPPVKLSTTPLEAKQASPTLGHDTVDLLIELGLARAEIERLVAEGAFGISS